MNRKTIFYVLLAIWLLLFAGAFVAFAMVGPEGDGFTRGLNRIGAFVGWQIAAGFFGLIVWLNASAFQRGSFGRWIGRLPIALAALFFLSIVGVIFSAQSGYSGPPIDTRPPGAVTQPAPKLD